MRRKARGFSTTLHPSFRLRFGRNDRVFGVLLRPIPSPHLHSSPTGTSVINLTGGSLYLGSGGIVQNSAVLATIKLASGILGAKDTWASTLDMQVNGGITVQAVDEANAAHDITLGGALSGAGTLTKTGLGKLTLSGAQNYPVLNASEGRTDVSGSFINDTWIVNVADNAKLNFGAAQVLDTLTIGDGASVTGGAQAVPEPGNAALLLGGMLTLLGLRRRQ